MKSITATLLACLVSCGIMAQNPVKERNTPINVWLGNIMVKDDTPKEQSKFGKAVSATNTAAEAVVSASVSKALPLKDVTGIDSALIEGLMMTPLVEVKGREPLPQTPGEGDVKIEVELTRGVSNTSVGYGDVLDVVLGSGSSSYGGFRMTLKDLSDGRTVASRNFNKSYLGSHDFGGKLKNSIKYAVRDFLCGIHPLYGNIIDAQSLLDENKKDVLIDLGAKDGVWKDLEFKICKAGPTIKGRPTSKTLGYASTKEVNDDTTLIHISKGKKEIAEELKNGTQLFVVNTTP